jgi:hypothetical protein
MGEKYWNSAQRNRHEDVDLINLAAFLKNRGERRGFEPSLY